MSRQEGRAGLGGKNKYVENFCKIHILEILSMKDDPGPETGWRYRFLRFFMRFFGGVAILYAAIFFLADRYNALFSSALFVLGVFTAFVKLEG